MTTVPTSKVTQTKQTTQLIADWFAKSQPLKVSGANTRIWREGDGEPVVCLHGVPASGFLYRKVLPELAKHGLEGITLDFPSMGFADRPDPSSGFDYSWTGLSAWLVDALDAAEIGDFHLVVHDIGGPIGFDVIRRIPQRIKSLTVLNTLVKVASFTKPWSMRPFEKKGLGELWLQSLKTPAFMPLLRLQGMMRSTSNAEILAYRELLLREDDGKAFLKVMRSFDAHADFEAGILPVLRNRDFPAQIIWGKHDPALPMKTFAPIAADALGLDGWHEVAGKHFLQEDAYVELAEHIQQLVSTEC